MELAWQRLDGRDGHSVGLELLGQLCPGPMPPIVRSERGKPRFASGPHFSVSHCKNHAFVAVSDKNIGIDAEEKDRDIDLRLAKRILSHSEMARYSSAPDRREALLRLWVLKEALAKLTGRGWGNYLYCTDFSPDDPRIAEIDGCYVAVLEEGE